MRERANYYQMDQSKIYPMLADVNDMLDLGAVKYQDRLTEMVAFLKPELIIIDSLSSVHTRGQKTGGLGELRGAAHPSHPQALDGQQDDECGLWHGGLERFRLHHPAGKGGDESARGADGARV